MRHRVLIGVAVAVGAASLGVLIAEGGRGGGAGADVVWTRSVPADLELSGRPQLVEFFHPL
jgi:hypothetical protein